MTKIILGLTLCSLAFLVGANDGKIVLPKPNLKGDMTLMQALAERQSIRAYADKELSMETLSELLWAANGINRADKNLRTAPSTRNVQAIDIYLILKDGIYRYEPQQHALELIEAGDFREYAGIQPFAKTAPVTLIYVVDTAKQGNLGNDPAKRREYSAIDCGFIGQNVYLYCASVGLGSVFRGMIDPKALAEKLQITDKQEVLFGQSVGYPIEK